MGWFFGKKRTYDQLQHKIGTIYGLYDTQLHFSEQYTQLQKKILRASLMCSFLYARICVGMVQEDHDLMDKIQDEPNPVAASRIANWNVLYFLCQKIEKAMGNPKGFDWILAEVSVISDVPEEYSSEYIKHYRRLADLGNDLKDIWFQQDIQFFQIILNKHYDINKYFFEKERLKSITFSIATQEMRGTIAKFFDETTVLV